MIRLLLKSALIAGAVYLPLYISLQVAPAFTAPLAAMMVGIAIAAAIRELLLERRLRSLVRHGRQPFRPDEGRGAPPPAKAKRPKKEAGIPLAA